MTPLCSHIAPVNSFPYCLKYLLLLFVYWCISFYLVSSWRLESICLSSLCSTDEVRHSSQTVPTNYGPGMSSMCFSDWKKASITREETIKLRWQEMGQTRKQSYWVVTGKDKKFAFYFSSKSPFFFFFFFFAALWTMQDLSSPIRAQTRAPCSGRMES